MVDEIEYHPSPSVVERIAVLFGATQRAYASGAGASKYRNVRVEIGEGQFRGDYLTGSFFVPEGPEYDIVSQDISTRLGGGRLRRPIKFSIVNNP